MSALKCFEENRIQAKRIVSCDYFPVDDPEVCFTKRIRGIPIFLNAGLGIDPGLESVKEGLELQSDRSDGTRRTIIRGCEEMERLGEFDRKLTLSATPSCIIASRSRHADLYFNLIREFARENSRDGYDIDIQAEEIEVCACNADLCNFASSSSSATSLPLTSTESLAFSGAVDLVDKNQTTLLGSALLSSIIKNVSNPSESLSNLCFMLSILTANFL